MKERVQLLNNCSLFTEVIFFLNPKIVKDVKFSI